MAIERMQLPVGVKFDPQNGAHVSKAMEKIAEKGHGTGWEIQSFDTVNGILSLVRRSAMTKVTKSAGKSDSYRVELMRGIKPTDGEQIAAQLESDPAHAGYFMTRFEPFLSEATMARLTPSERRTRAAVAVALGVKPWDVLVADRRGGGFDLQLPSSYVPSRHLAKLTEVAETIVGRPGWFVKTNAERLTAEIIPAEMPTFPETVPYPIRSLSALTWDKTPFGVKLPEPGKNDDLDQAFIDWTESQMALIAGLPGAGKSVLINAIIAGWLAAGGEIVVVDVPDKKSDFLWMKQWCRVGGWGCESDLGALTALSLVYEEGRARAALNEQHGVTGWRDLSPAVRRPPILVVADELSGLIVTEKMPTGVPKDNPIVQAKLERNLVRVSIEDIITRMVAEQRAMGIHVLLSTQVTNNNTGVGPSTKAKIGQKVLQGANPSKTQRQQAFSVEDQVPGVPENVKASGAVARGTGSSELAGQEPFVHKTFFASVADYQRALTALGVPIPGHPEPTPTDIARFDPTAEDGDYDEPPARLKENKAGFGHQKRAPEPWEIGPDGEVLTGFARANAARHQAAVAARAASTGGQG